MEIKKEGNNLTITCPLGSGVPSSTGKTLILATTNGFQPVPGTDLKVSLNVIKSRKS
jgi:NAD(P)H-flavin reductase